jgi:hypothetical protein
MSFSKTERALIAAGMKEQNERISFNRELRRELAGSAARRAVVADRYRQRVLEKGLKAAGIDYGTIVRRQQLENASVQREVNALKKKLGAYAEKVERRHAQTIDQAMRSKSTPISRKGPAPPSPSDVSLGYLWQPRTFSLNDMGDPQDATLTTANESNLLRFKWYTKVGGFWNPYITLSLTYLVTPPKSGTLGVFSLAAFNGSASWATPGSCSAYQPFLDVYFIAYMAVQQVDGNGNLQTQMTQGAIHESHGGGCLPHNGSKGYDTVQYLQFDNPILVVARQPVLITVTVTGDCFGYSVAGELDFQTGSRSINLPGILFGFEPS